VALPSKGRKKGKKDPKKAVLRGMGISSEAERLGKALRAGGRQKLGSIL